MFSFLSQRFKASWSPRFFSSSKAFTRNIGIISVEEQQKLANSKVAIAGVGTDGGLTAERLARIGIGELRLADPDTFDTSNTNRQFGADITTTGANKAVVLSRIIKKINPAMCVKEYSQGVTEDNVEDFVSGADVVLDEVDYFRPDVSLLLHREARRQNKYVFLAVNVGWGANLFVFDPRGMTIEEYIGVSHDISLNEAKNYHIPPEKFSPNIPPYWSDKLINDIVQSKIPIPSVAPAAALEAALLSTAVVMLLAKNAVYDIVPGFTSIDLFTGKARLSSLFDK